MYSIIIARLSSSSISVVRSTIVCPYFKDLEVLHVVPGINSRPGHWHGGCAPRRKEARTSGATPIDHEECNGIFDRAKLWTVHSV